MAKNETSGARESELERLRDILYGDYARGTTDQLGELKDELNIFRKEMLKSLSDQDSDQSNQLETTRQTLEDKLNELNRTITTRIDELEAHINQRLDALMNEKTNRFDLGQMLVAMGEQLQNGMQNGVVESNTADAAPLNEN